MDLARRFGSWVCLYLVGVCFFLTAASFAFFHVINADNVKQTLSQEGTYSKVVPAVLSTAQYEKGNGSEGQLPLEEPWVRQAADKAFSADDLEKKGDALIDGTFDWLEGETDKPQFVLDFSNNKEHLSDEIGNYALGRMNGLPRCARNNIPQSIDAFRNTCLPPDTEPALVANTVRNQVLGDQEFLEDPVITSDKFNFKPVGAADGQDPFASLNNVRSFYKNRGVWQWLLPILTILFAVLGTLLARDRSKALRRLSWSFFSSAVSLLGFGLLIGAGFSALVKAVTPNQFTEDVVNPALLSLSGQVSRVYFVFAAVAVVLGIVFLLSRRKLLPKSSA